uniref:Dehydrin COR410 n=2 Tax=Triticum aestivum TaxID=4565 RepID=CO410_WHEAT|nr:RecName: Full=Dehydrin COR410; AltName: Full=Cold-induced COR410 protein [Triticum aestivum]AAA20189.1 cold acclimation protein [Triticum aestivum]ABV24865.1 dehydrin WZY1-2 [Triticum aestivum]
MEDERSTQSYQGGEAAEQVEVTDRGLLGNLLGKKKAEEDKEKEEELVTGMEKVSVEEPEVKKEEHEDGEKKETLFSKLHRSSSSSSSSSDEEEEEVIDDNGEVIKRKKKKGLKEKLQGKLPGHKDTEGEHVTGLPAPAAPASVQTHGGHHDTDVVVEKIDGDVKTEAAPAVPEEEKKGFLEKIKEKLPGGHKKPEDAAAVPVTHAAPAPVHAPVPAPEEVSSPDAKEKKGLLGKIMDKLPGYHKTGEEDKAAAATGEHKPSA